MYAEWKFYTWKDVDRYCQQNQNEWKDDFNFIEVYPSEIILCKKENNNRNEKDILMKLFDEKYRPNENVICLDQGDIQIPVTVEITEDESQRQMRPLFRDVLYRSSSYPVDRKLPELPQQVIAFHSYKGGVGRTLSLLAFARAWATVFPTEKQGRMLIVDADIEAPGLSWIHDYDRDALSYLDILTLIQDGESAEDIINQVCKYNLAKITVETQERNTEHYFIPVYRYKEQLLDIYADPQTIVNSREKAYILAEVLSGIAERKKIGMVLVDLRAGLSEYSATLLFDSRVKKYLVTSTSRQSLRGTHILLEYLVPSLKVEHDDLIPEVFLNMVQEQLNEEEKKEIIADLLQKYESIEKKPEDLTQDVITTLPFASELVHLTSLSQIFHNLDGRTLYRTIEQLIRNNYTEVPNKDQLMDRHKILKSIHTLADAQLTAESGHNLNVLMTKPLKVIRDRFGNTIPSTVIMGAKGAGKTFLFQKMCASFDWKSFCRDALKEDSDQNYAYFLPVLSPKNSPNLQSTLTDCIKKLNEQISTAQANENAFLDNQQTLKNELTAERIDWYTVWEKLLVSSLNPNLNNFREADSALGQAGRKVVFLIDGLEECFEGFLSNEKQREAIRTLSQDIVNTLNAKYAYLGIIVFLRKDIARSSITTNYLQFEQVYRNMELRWTSEEALRLVVWMVNQAYKGFYNGTTPLDEAPRDVIDPYLEKLWGKKLGKPTSNEARSSNWIIAALSDFNRTLQARDVIRFLMFASEAGQKSAPYTDRLLMPTEIRAAIPNCSIQKLAEIKEENGELKKVFEMIENLPQDKKQMPLDPVELEISAKTEQNMVDAGFLRRMQDKYYFPEIVRHGLGLRYEKGARPKVLSIMNAPK